MADPGHQSLDLCRKIEAHQFTGTAAQVISEQDELQLKPIMGYTQIFHLPYAKFDLYDSNFA
jgi:hypothetical protein